MKFSENSAKRRAPSGRGGAGAARPGGRLRDAERQWIEEALARRKGSRTRAAEDLGISRRTLHRKINEYGLRSPRDG